MTDTYLNKSSVVMGVIRRVFRWSLFWQATPWIAGWAMSWFLWALQHWLPQAWFYLAYFAVPVVVWTTAAVVDLTYSNDYQNGDGHEKGNIEAIWIGFGLFLNVFIAVTLWGTGFTYIGASLWVWFNTTVLMASLYGAKAHDDFKELLSTLDQEGRQVKQSIGIVKPVSEGALSFHRPEITEAEITAVDEALEAVMEKAHD